MNRLHEIHQGRRQAVCVLASVGGVQVPIAKFKSVCEAARKLRMPRSNIQNNLRREYRSRGYEVHYV